MALLTLLNVAKIQIDGLVPSKPTRKQDSQECAVTLAPQLFGVWRIPEPLGLFRREPIAESYSDFLDALDTSDAGSEIRA
ncbi:MAG: hypothetical protein HYZ57_06975 [Acidobacteria bacterium]|nr:hypothetical protein [Acidobacteriota bacterium]MBI3279565.1 hypothetical protein [Acidobacteriota bacterium]